MIDPLHDIQERVAGATEGRMVLVPVEPTDAMLRAWYETQCPPGQTPAGSLSRWATWDEAKVVRGDEMARCYRAMIRAARLSQHGEG